MRRQLELVHRSPNVYTVDEFLTAAEAQHLLDVAFGRPPRSRCGVRLIQATPTALLEDGAPLCPACAAITHPPAVQVEIFNHRADEHPAPR